MKKLAIENKEEIKADVILKINKKSASCDFCGEEDKLCVVGQELESNELYYSWRDVTSKRLYSQEKVNYKTLQHRGFFKPFIAEYTVKLGDDELFRVIRNEEEPTRIKVTPCICLDCIKQLSRLISK